MHDERSRELYDRALSVLPGGVNSPVRAVRPYPFFVERGDGAHVVDADGNKYLDYAMGYGPLLLGHDLPQEVESRVQSRLADGPMYGAPTEVEVELAEFIARHVTSIEMVRFVNSGTEATTTAVRLARGYTDRDKLVVMQGGYHGAQESTLVEGKSGGVGSPSSDGIPEAFAEETITVPFNDEGAIREVFEERGDEIAAVLTEPILGNCASVGPVEGYLETLREVTDDHGALLIFDEVMTGFRVGGLQCAQGKFGVEPDLTTLAKVIGGGFPVGAVGGPARIMESLAPTGEVFHAGTYSGHPLSLTAGLEMLRYAAENDVYDHLADLGDQLRSGLADVLEDRAPEYTVTGHDSMFKVVFTRDRDARLANSADVDAAETERWERLFWPAMREQGVFLTPNQYESQFLSYAHTEDDVEETLAAYQNAL
ncbi:glutamate-1-semialdehyde 2,1-aminomutase [Halorussus halobius]|uniref:glutamate-1-semialdehyde 2,1-aminomutase n=1 Tax=Halorussus halobius TaxID=1710537 RepID=UPI001092CB69|nr:glutamate-1-semialdehyde 2,1-aminomutase [Halorussus halobius]